MKGNGNAGSPGSRGLSDRRSPPSGKSLLHSSIPVFEWISGPRFTAGLFFATVLASIAHTVETGPSGLPSEPQG